MGTVADKLNYLNDTKQAIKQAIIDKGVSVADADTFRSYADKILSIQSGSGGLEYVLKDGTFNYDVLTDGIDFNNIINTFTTTAGVYSEPVKEYGSSKVYGWGDINGNAFTLTDGKFYKAQNNSIGSSESNIDIPVKNLTGRKMIGIRGTHLNDNGGWSMFYLQGLKVDPSTGLTTEYKNASVSALSGYTSNPVNSGDYFFCSYVDISTLSQLDYIRLRTYDGEWNVSEIFIV